MKNKILATLSCIILAGCVEPPANMLKLHTPKGDYTWTSPKNVTMEGLKAMVSPDGTIDIVVNHISSTNDPQVISKTAAGQAALVREYGKAMNSAFTNGINAAKSFQGVP